MPDTWDEGSWRVETVSNTELVGAIDGATHVVKTPPEQLKTDTLATALSARWGIADALLTYVPLGFGSHHWIAEAPSGDKWFITVDDLRADHLAETDEQSVHLLTTAFQTAANLREVITLPFVIGPVPDQQGTVTALLADHFSLAVFPFLDVAPTEYGEFRDPVDRAEALQLVGQIHNATDRVPVSSLRRDTLTIPDRPGLVEALAATDEPWRAGPYSEPARLLLRETAGDVLRKLRDFDHLVSQTTGDPASWVVTHGEPHAGNIVRTRRGQLVVVDWDSVALAPRERDLWMLVNGSNPDWTPYRDATGVTSLSDSALATYRTHWDLSEIAIYTAWCRRVHDRTEEMAIAWEGLQQYVAN